ncbi:hypothetical protein BLOT_001730 [Blomia tropicalis]|nr:hypothetical protein BLOT_001730 [Blomia tropicalis]
MEEVPLSAFQADHFVRESTNYNHLHDDDDDDDDDKATNEPMKQTHVQCDRIGGTIRWVKRRKCHLYLYILLQNVKCKFQTYNSATCNQTKNLQIHPNQLLVVSYLQVQSK